MYGVSTDNVTTAPGRIKKLRNILTGIMPEFDSDSLIIQMPRPCLKQIMALDLQK